MDKKSIVGILIILVLFIGAIVYSFKTTEDVVLNGIDVTARILSFNNGVKSRGNFQCEINYKGKTIKLIGASSVNKGLFDYIGKTFPC